MELALLGVAGSAALGEDVPVSPWGTGTCTCPFPVEATQLWRAGSTSQRTAFVSQIPATEQSGPCQHCLDSGKTRISQDGGRKQFGVDLSRTPLQPVDVEGPKAPSFIPC